MGAWEGLNDGAAVSVAASGTTTLCTILVQPGAEYLWTGISNASTQILDAFAVQVREHEDSSFTTLASATADFTSAIKEPILGCNMDLTSLAKSAKGLLRMNVRGLNAVRFTASADTGATVVSVYWTMR